jgi:hypothetical protein
MYVNTTLLTAFLAIRSTTHQRSSVHATRPQ